jgi:hypothetical protein
MPRSSTRAAIEAAAGGGDMKFYWPGLLWLRTLEQGKALVCHDVQVHADAAAAAAAADDDDVTAVIQHRTFALDLPCCCYTSS